MAEEEKEFEITNEVAEEQTEAAVPEEQPVQEVEEEIQPKAQKPKAPQQEKQPFGEDDDAPVGTLTLRQIVGGDYLFALVRHHILLILLVVGITTVYIAVRYQCQQDVIEVNQLEDELVKAKYKALSSSSHLTEMCRQSNVLRLNQDTLLKISDQPPFIIEVPEE